MGMPAGTRKARLARLVAVGVCGALAWGAGPLPAAPGAPALSDDPATTRAATDPDLTPGAARASRTPDIAGSVTVPSTRRAAAATSRRVVLDEWDTSATPPSDRRRLRQVTVTQDLSSGRLSAVARFAAVPTEAQESVLEVYVGRWSGDSCVMDAAMLAAAWTPGETNGVWDESALGVTRSRSGADLTLRSTTSAGRIRTADWTCAFARLRSPDAATIYQNSFAASLEDQHAPRLEIRAGEPIQGARAGKRVDLRVEVRNASQSDAAGVVLRASGKGLAISRPRRDLGLIADRTTRYGITFSVKLKGAKSRTLTFRASTGGRTFTRRITIVRTPKPRTFPSLAGRYFWGHGPTSSSQGWDNRAVWFLDRRWVHLGFPKNGVEPTCRSTSRKCQRYRYDKRAGKVTFGGRSARVSTAGFRHRGVQYYATTPAARGQRFAVSLLRNDFEGFCGIACTTWTEWLVMTKQGRFVLTRQTIGSIGAPGVGTIWSSVGPGDKGRYQVISPGRVELRFADGTRQRHRLVIEYDAAGRPNAAVAGLVLGERNFYWDE